MSDYRNKNAGIVLSYILLHVHICCYGNTNVCVFTNILGVDKDLTITVLVQKWQYKL